MKFINDEDIEELKELDRNNKTIYSVHIDRNIKNIFIRISTSGYNNEIREYRVRIITEFNHAQFLCKEEELKDEIDKVCNVLIKSIFELGEKIEKFKKEL